MLLGMFTIDKSILLLKPRLNGSWFIPSNKECDNDTIGCWPPETKFPSEKMPTKSPKDSPFKPPRGISDFEYSSAG